MILPYIALGIACALPGIAYAYACYRQKIRKKHHLAESELILGNVNAYFILIDSDLKVLRTNYYSLNHIPASDEPKRVGDLLHCRNALESPGCGTHELCKICGIRAAIGQGLAKGESFKDQEASMEVFRHDRRQMAPCDVSVSGTYLETSGEKRMVLTVIDITRLKDTQKQLNAEKEKAVASDRLKSAFIANMSHEIRTPLHAISGFSDLLASAEDKEEKNAYADIVSRNSRQLLHLFDDILDLAKMESGTLDFNYSDFRIDELLKDLYGTFAGALKEKTGITLIQEPVPELPLLHSERERVFQVLSNFIDNALKFTAGGEIRFGATRQDDGYIRFYVSDTGIGIAEEEQEKIFGRFTKLDHYLPGSGLGLAISQLIVEKLGGTIGVESRPGKGSTFWFTLPLDPIG